MKSPTPSNHDPQPTRGRPVVGWLRSSLVVALSTVAGVVYAEQPAISTSRSTAEPAHGVGSGESAVEQSKATSSVDGATGDSGAASGAASEAATGELPTGVEIISANGAITRATCPHTCASRNIPKEHCREWTSKMYGDRCYVQDLRLPTSAIAPGGTESDTN